MSFAFLLFFKILIFNVDSCYKAFKSIRHELQKAEDPKAENGQVQVVLDCIDRAEPLTGCGMFQITRSTLTSMISISVTYLIVLLQFKLSF